LHVCIVCIKNKKENINANIQAIRKGLCREGKNRRGKRKMRIKAKKD
jgi:hypothetical protein